MLSHWVTARHFLGNHTYSHVDLDRIDSAEYIREIENNARGLPNPKRVSELYDLLPEVKLESICK